MTPERWKKINEVFQSAVELESDDQADYLDKECAQDESLRQQVETLLAANDNAGTFIAGNAAQDAAHLLDQDGDKTLTGENLEHYEIISVLGSGGMGKVYLAKDSKLNRSIAIKTLPESFSKHREHIKRFQTEAKAAATLNHPNVATVYSVEESGENRYFITMEYVEGRSLDEMMTAGGTDLRTFLNWFVPLSDALAHAHRKGVIHRDIKPTNVIITPSGAPKILDFGLARIDRTGSEEKSTLSLTKTGQVLGTPAYMAPEQAEGKPSDNRTDIFSLGVVMYEAITGERPFRGDNYASIISALLTKQPTSVSEMRTDVPAMIARLIMKCLEKNPQNRYQSMDEVRVLLSEMGSAVESGTALSRSEPQAGLFSSRFVKTGLAAVCGAIIIAGGFGIWSWYNSGGVTVDPVTRFSIPAPNGDTISLFHADLSPDGTAIVFAVRNSPKKELRLRLLNKNEIFPIAGTDDARNPFFSPDGNSIGYFSGEKTMKRIPRIGGNPLSICDTCSADSTAHWGANGLIIGSDDVGLYSVPANGGAPKRLTTVDSKSGEIGHLSPQLLPDNDSVLFTIQNKELVRFAIYSLSGGESKDVYKLEGSNTDHGRASFAQYIDSGHLIFSRGKQLFAVVFDPATKSVSGVPVPILDGTFSVPNFKISRNGTLVYLPEAPTDENLLVWVDRNGVEKPVFEKRGSYQSPRLSPDGARIAVQVDKDIWVYEVADGRGVRLTFEGENQVPLWSKDGNSVVYASKRENLWTIYQKSVEGSGSPEKLASSEIRQLPYSWHPAEPVIALATVPAVNNSDIAFLSLEGNNIQSVLSTNYKEDTPRFSPDGKWLTYFSTETGGVKVYVQSTSDQSNKTAISKGSGMFPVWSSSGRELFYRQGRKLIAVNVEPGDNFSVGTSRVLFSGKYLTSFDVTVDGSKFLMVKNEKGSMPTHLNVVLGWNREFEQVFSSKK